MQRKLAQLQHFFLALCMNSFSQSFDRSAITKTNSSSTNSHFGAGGLSSTMGIPIFLDGVPFRNSCAFLSSTHHHIVITSQTHTVSVSVKPFSVVARPFVSLKVHFVRWKLNWLV